MDKVYFLIAIGVLALVLVSWLVRVEWRRSKKAKKQKARVDQMVKVSRGHAPAVRHGLPSRTTSLPPRHVGAWEKRQQRAGEEMRHGSAITAERIFSDEEAPDLEGAHGLAMPAIRFVPEDAPREWQPRR